MNYEEKYNEALERARKLKEMYPQDAPGYEEVFPELRESEDERIRKEIVEFIRSQIEDGNSVGWDRWIAYLEKQKENPKSADSIPSDCVSDAKCEDRSLKHSDSDGTDIRDTPAYWKGWDDAMKQKEQNHPKGCFTCDEYKKGYEIGRLNGFTAGYNKAMKEVDQKEQKPELVEHPPIVYEYNSGASKDERLKKALIALLGSDLIRVEGTFFTKQDLIDWVENRPTPEWSEEDDQLIGFIFDLLNDLVWQKDWAMSKEECLERLKSLRHQPKVELSEDVKKTLDEVSHILIGLNYKQVAKDYKQAVEKLLSTRN